jgi:hypothetical protein
MSILSYDVAWTSQPIPGGRMNFLSQEAAAAGHSFWISAMWTLAAGSSLCALLLAWSTNRKPLLGRHHRVSRRAAFRPLMTFGVAGVALATMLLPITVFSHPPCHGAAVTTASWNAARPALPSCSALAWLAAEQSDYIWALLLIGALVGLLTALAACGIASFRFRGRNWASVATIAYSWAAIGAATALLVRL